MKIVFLTSNYQLKEILAIIEGLNIQVALDNFGTGISSLTNVHKFPFEYLKIDTSLVKNLANNQDSINLVKSILKIAESLNMRVIAQGIENEETLDILKSLGCEYGQGFIFSEPLFFDQFNQYLFRSCN